MKRNGLPTCFTIKLQSVRKESATHCSRNTFTVVVIVSTAAEAKEPHVDTAAAIQEWFLPSCPNCRAPFIEPTRQETEATILNMLQTRLLRSRSTMKILESMGATPSSKAFKICARASGPVCITLAKIQVKRGHLGMTGSRECKVKLKCSGNWCQLLVFVELHKIRNRSSIHRAYCPQHALRLGESWFLVHI